MTLNNLLLTIILIVWIILLSYTLVNPFDYTIITEGTFHLHVVRALVTVTFLAIILFYGMNLNYGIYLTKHQEKENAFIAFTSIFLITAIYSLALYIWKFKSPDWKALFNDWFGKDETFIHNDKKEKNLRISL